MDNDNKVETTYKDRSLVLRIIGGFLLVAGLASFAIAAPEIYTIYFFTEGGRFHYEGFGFGSFLFAFIAVQVVGYYLIALVSIPLGYGHLALRTWARKLMLVALWVWLIIGAPIVLVAMFMMLSVKELTVAGALLLGVLFFLSYTAIPGALIWFYNTPNVRQTFINRDHRSYWIDSQPVSIMVACALFVFYIVSLNALLLFNGIFPFLNRLIFGFPGVILINISVVVLVLLIVGYLSKKIWAWWGSLIFIGALALSTILAFSNTSYADLLAQLAFPPTELDALDGIPLQGYHLALLVGGPMLLMLIVIVFTRREYKSG